MDEIPALNPPKKRRTLLIVALVGIALLVCAVGTAFLIRSVIASGITKGPDNMFGDQNLRTAVALIELHKVRYGNYPDSLQDLRFLGQWDQIALNSVSYYPNENHSAYYIEVERGGQKRRRIDARFERATS
jgi:hypothetical protein